jgi:hypothetical protein
MFTASPFDINYYSTTAFLHGPDQAVKYVLVPTSRYRSSIRNALFGNFLSENMRRHLAAEDATFDFCVSRAGPPPALPPMASRCLP